MMSSPPSKKDAFEELFSSSETLHVTLKRPASVLLTSLPPTSFFTMENLQDEAAEDPEDLPSLNDLSVAQLKGDAQEDHTDEDSLGLIKRAVRARSRVPTELLQDETLPDDVKLMCNEYNAVVEDVRGEIAVKDKMDVVARQERRKSVLFELSLSAMANGILTAESIQ